MHLNHLIPQFQKRESQGTLAYRILLPATGEQIAAAEQRLSVSFPLQVKLFYQQLNGLHVDDPPLEILPLDRLEFDSKSRLHFATLDNCHSLYFATSFLNEARQWDILAADGYRVTLTMASFWTNKIWAWIDHRRKIWHPDEQLDQS